MYQPMSGVARGESDDAAPRAVPAGVPSILRAVLDATADGILVVDRGRRIVAWNRRLLELWGMPDEMVAQADAGRVERYMAEQQADPAAFLSLVGRRYAATDAEAVDVLEPRGGRVLERHTRPYRLDGEGDGAAGRVWSFRDTSAARESEERYRALAEADPDGIVVLDDESRILSVNPAMERIFGFTPEQIIGEPLTRLMPERLRDSHRRGIERYLASGIRSMKWEGVQVPGLRRDGTEIPLEINFGEYTVEGRHCFAGFIRDITERKRIEGALQHAKDEAESANLAKSEFLSRMSHELRTPLNSILGFGQVLGRRGLSSEQRRDVDHIMKAGRHLLSLIDELLDISRIEANRQQLSVEPVHAGELLEEALALIRPMAQQRPVTLDERAPAAADVHVRADRQRLMQVVLNLLSNAVKYNRPGGVVALLADTVQRDGQARLRLGVRDGGPGIPADRLGELFVPFSRLGAEDGGVEGTGLGLALSKRLMEAMNGEMRVESIVGQGSTFWVELPVAPHPLARLETYRRASAPAPLRERPRRPRTILYVEDNLANLNLVESIFEDRPEIQLLPALQGRMGLELAREHRPDLILLDLHLPDISGEEVLRELHSDPRTEHVPVLVISADATQRQIQRLRVAGARGYLTKPLDLDEFLEKVDLLL